MLTIQERVYLVEHVFLADDKFTENVKRFPNSVYPHRDSLRDLITKFRETGSVHGAPKSGRPKTLTEAKLDEISDVMLRSPTKSVRKLAQETNVSVQSAHRAVREELKLSPYKFTVVLELK